MTTTLLLCMVNCNRQRAALWQLPWLHVLLLLCAHQQIRLTSLPCYGSCARPAAQSAWPLMHQPACWSGSLCQLQTRCRSNPWQAAQQRRMSAAMWMAFASGMLHVQSVRKAPCPLDGRHCRCSCSLFSDLSRHYAWHADLLTDIVDGHATTQAKCSPKSSL